MQISGFQGTLNDVTTIWKKNALNWQRRRMPWRPSPGDISLYRKLISEKLPGRTLILGATPELRDLIASTDNEVTLIDICPEMISAASKLLTTSQVEKETHVIGNWQKMPFDDAQFDIVVGDFFWWLFSIPNQKLLRNEIARILKSNGVLVTRIHFTNTNFIGKELDNIIRVHLQFLDEGTRDPNDIKEILISRLLDATTDKKSQRLNTSRARIAAEKILSDNTINKQQRSFLEECASALRGRVDWTSQNREQILRCIGKRFTLEQEVSSSDYEDSHFFPVLKLRKN